ncbi:hypothetical protein NOVOSPHI9U_310018 [Novosphingobium sp. 9U]|nr:hypothetical protein NOVOSPHI9U_310018 [Novosphingobium sp. 9U]
MKFARKPNLTSFLYNRTGNLAFSTNCSSIINVLSVETSSQTTSSCGAKTCSFNDCNCSDIKRSPLHVAKAIEIRHEFKLPAVRSLSISDDCCILTSDMYSISEALLSCACG